MIRMPCTACEGTGEVEMPPELRDTLALLRRSPADAGKIAKQLGVSHNLVNNRLERLRTLGFATRARLDGRTWEYTATPRDRS